MVSGDGKVCVTSGQGVAMGSPKRSAKRRASVRAAATVTCWPSTARTTISKLSTHPGRRRPGPPGRPARASSMVSGEASRSSQRRTPATTRALCGASEGANCSRTWAARVSVSGTNSACNQPAPGAIAPARRLRRTHRPSTCSTPGIARSERKRSIAAVS